MDANRDVNRRMVRRWAGHTLGPVTVRTHAGSATTAEVADNSILGISVVLKERLPVGAALIIGPDKSYKGSVAQVRHTRPLPDGRSLVGCQFAKTLSINEMMQLGEPSNTQKSGFFENPGF